MDHSTGLMAGGVIEVFTEVVEVAGQGRVKITVRRGDEIIDAEMVNPLNAGQRRRVAQRMAVKCGDALAAERIEGAILQCVEALEKGRGDRGEGRGVGG